VDGKVIVPPLHEKAPVVVRLVVGDANVPALSVSEYSCNEVLAEALNISRELSRVKATFVVNADPEVYTVPDVLLSTQLVTPA